MKNIFYISVLSLIIACISCRKTSSPLTHTITSLDSVDRWILIESLSDPGDGSGKWQPVDKQNYYFIKFNKDSSITTNTLGFPEGLTRYKTLTDSTILLFYADGHTVTLFYKIDSTLLTISGGCFEACGLKFKADL